MPSVLYLYAKNVSVRIQRICHYIIRDWRGLAELLILVKGNAKARSWDKQESFSHVFFCIHNRSINFYAKAGRVVGEKNMMVQEPIESAQIQLTNCAKELLCKINEVWKQLQEEPKGKYKLGFIHLPPCSVSYWNNLKKLDSLLIELSQENIEGLFIPFHEFRHTMNKEGSYVRDFTPNKGKKQNATNNELKKLMDDSNSHIGRDLYSIFKLSKSIVDGNSKLG